MEVNCLIPPILCVLLILAPVMQSCWGLLQAAKGLRGPCHEPWKLVTFIQRGTTLARQHFIRAWQNEKWERRRAYLDPWQKRVVLQSVRPIAACELRLVSKLWNLGPNHCCPLHGKDPYRVDKLLESREKQTSNPPPNYACFFWTQPLHTGCECCPWFSLDPIIGQSYRAPSDNASVVLRDCIVSMHA